MRVGITLPTFRADAAALDAARRAERLGLDGVFVFDHLWPVGGAGRPALSAFPVLGAVAAATTAVHVGPLVARIGLAPDAVLVAALLSLDRMAPGRLIAGMGTGDSLSAGENLAYGIAFPPADQRRLALRRCADAVAAAGVPVWVGGGSPSTTELAADLGVAVNLWEGQPAAVAAQSVRCEVTWGGPLPDDVPAMVARLSALAQAGASWAVCAWPPSLEAVAEAAALVRPGPP